MSKEALLGLARRQHGLVHRRQLTDAGLSEDEYRHLVRCGRWRHLSPTVLELVGTPDTVDKRVMLAVLDLGLDAVVSFRTAAARWELPGFALLPVHVMGHRETGRRKSPLLGVVHQPRLLLPEHVLMLDGIPTTSPTRTLFDLAGVLRPERTERALDNALAAGLTTIPRLEAMLEQLACKGRPGITTMRSLLKERPVGYVPPASGLESRFQQIAREVGFDGFERQVNVGDDYDLIGRVDFVERKLRAIVEVQSDRFHKALVDRRRDRERLARLRAAGWLVLEAEEHDIWHDRPKVEADLRRLRRDAAARDQAHAKPSNPANPANPASGEFSRCHSTG